VLFHIQDKALRSLLSGPLFTCMEELSPDSPAAMLRKDSDVGNALKPEDYYLLLRNAPPG